MKPIIDTRDYINLRRMVLKGNKEDFMDAISLVAMQYIAAVRGTDYIKDGEWIKIAGKTFEAKCPYCGKLMELNLEEVAKNETM